MFKSIFARLSIIFIIVIALMLGCVSLYFYYFSNRYYINEAQRELRSIGMKCSSYFRSYVLGMLYPEAYEPLMENEVSQYLSMLSRADDIYVWVIDDSGKIVLFYGVTNNTELTYGDFLEEGEFEYLFENYDQQYTQMYSKYFTGSMYSCGFQLNISSPQSNYAVVLHKSMDAIRYNANTVANALFAAVILLGILAVVLFAFISRRITEPINAMSVISQEIARGKFDKRVEVSGKDEIAVLAKNINSMAESLQKIEDQRSSFLANVSHELRSPLTSIHGYLQGMVDGVFDPEKSQQYMKISLSETERMKTLIENLLSMSRFDANKSVIRWQEFDINELIRIVIISKIEQIEARKIEVEVNFEEDSFLVKADKDQIQQVVINIVDNATKYNVEGGVIIISTKLVKDKVQVSIADKGPGIPKEDLPYIWDRFYQVDKARSPSRQGSGLGLCIVKQIISNMGEEIWAESEVGKGTCFTFTLQHIKKIKQSKKS